MSTDARDAGLTTVTTTSVLDGLRASGNRTVWHEFHDRYRPVIVGIARRRGLNDADADDAAQRTLLEFLQAYRQGKYDRAKGRLRHWLVGIARRQISNLAGRGALREVQAVDTSSQTDIFQRQLDPADDTPLDQIELEEWRRGVYQECLARIRQQFGHQTVEAFLLFAWEGRPAQQVAQALGMTTNAVFLAKHKILRRIQEMLPQLEETS